MIMIYNPSTVRGGEVGLYLNHENFCKVKAASVIKSFKYDDLCRWKGVDGCGVEC